MDHQSLSVLCVDLDGTLVRSDTLAESLITLIHRNPLYILLLPVWLLRGRPYWKLRVASAVDFDPAAAPYNLEFLKFLQAEHGRGRRLVLATASHARVAEKIAAHLGIFTDVHATDEARNLKGQRKASLLAERYGEGAFSYAGDSRSDLPVWRVAKSAILVGVSHSVEAQLDPGVTIERRFPRGQGVVRGLFRALRPHHWVKNLLLAVPLLTAHRFGDIAALQALALAVVAMCLVASAIYIVNDLIDLPADRAHATKRQRPFAAGIVPIALGIAAIPVLTAGAITLAAMLPAAFGGGLALYAVAAIAYSLWIKRVIVLDVLLLALLYTLRIYLGGAAVVVPVSGWLLALTVFLFLSLALLKRYTELEALIGSSGREHARGYHLDDRRLIEIVGVISAVLAVLVMALYVNSPIVSKLYRHPVWLWGVSPLLLYWLAHAWHVARRGDMHDDPIVFALHEWGTYAIALGVLGLMYLAI